MHNMNRAIAETKWTAILEKVISDLNIQENTPMHDYVVKLTADLAAREVVILDEMSQRINNIQNEFANKIDKLAEELNDNTNMESDAPDASFYIHNDCQKFNS